MRHVRARRAGASFKPFRPDLGAPDAPFKVFCTNRNGEFRLQLAFLTLDAACLYARKQSKKYSHNEYLVIERHNVNCETERLRESFQAGISFREKLKSIG